MSLITCQTVARESLEMLKGNLKFQAAMPDFMKPTIRSGLIEAIGAWRAEAILGPAPTITIRTPLRYGHWMS